MKIETHITGEITFPPRLWKRLDFYFRMRCYLHIYDDKVIINDISENAYSTIYIEEDKCIKIPYEIAWQKLGMFHSGPLKMKIKKRQIIFPLKKQYMRTNIRYICALDHFNRTILCSHLREAYDLPIGSVIEYDYDDKGRYIISRDYIHEEPFFKIDDDGRIIIPNDVANKTAGIPYIEFIPTIDGIIIDKVEHKDFPNF